MKINEAKKLFKSNPNLLKFLRKNRLKIKMISPKKYTRGLPWGTFSLRPLEIELYVNKAKSQTDLLLTLLHELGHYMDYKRGNKQIPDAWLLEDQRMSDYDPKLTKKQRKTIYLDEVKGIKLMPEIAKELDLKIPKYKIYANMWFDIWSYRYYYDTGNFAPDKIRAKQKRKFLRACLDHYGK